LTTSKTPISSNFRLLLTYLLEKNDERAKELLDKVPLLNDTPVYFYSHAAWEFGHGNEKEAQSYISSAETVFPKSQTRELHRRFL
jgi:hypothetical protein